MGQVVEGDFPGHADYGLERDRSAFGINHGTLPFGSLQLRESKERGLGNHR